MAKGRITINEARCKGCALCVTTCPPQVLNMSADKLNVRGYHPVQFTDPDSKCTGCALCAVMCPEAALTIYRYKAVRSGASAVGAPVL